LFFGKVGRVNTRSLVKEAKAKQRGKYLMKIRPLILLKALSWLYRLITRGKGGVGSKCKRLEVIRERKGRGEKRNHFF